MSRPRASRDKSHGVYKVARASRECIRYSFALSFGLPLSCLTRDGLLKSAPGALLSACFPMKLFPLPNLPGDNVSCPRIYNRIRLQALPGVTLSSYIFYHSLSFPFFFTLNSHLSLSCSATCFPFRHPECYVCLMVFSPFLFLFFCPEIIYRGILFILLSRC